MRIQYILPLSFLLIASSCYNYDGPTRQRADLTKKSEPIARNTEQPETIELNESSEAYLVRVAKAIKKAVPSAQIEMLQDSIKVLFPDNIQYENSSVVPKNDVYNELRKLAALIIQYDKTNVLVVGHSDKGGDEELNKRLSSLRAGYIEQLLLAYEAPQDRINSWGIGSSSPLASELTPNGADKNRRVEFVIMAIVNSDDGDY